ncbi:MAG: CDP-glycerol glycerophosphotransferase family protein [Bacteroidales bacterium]|nr:CDP-glycerol glycerophosphotransferase family protein [Bacteroidales bacterium]
MKRESTVSLVWKLVKGIFFLPTWHRQDGVNRDPNLWVFGAWRGERYADNSRALFEFVLHHHPEIKAVWIARSEDVFRHLDEQKLPVVMADSREGVEMQRKASVAVISWGINEDMDARYLNGAKILFLWHGMPLKKIGKDEMAFKTNARSRWKQFKTRLRERVLPYECMLAVAARKGRLVTVSTAPFFTPFLQSAWLLDRPFIWEVGMPRNDKLFDVGHEKMMEILDREYDKPVKVLYMPTFRDQCSEVSGCFNPFERAGFQADSFCKMLEEQNMVFLYKGHFMDQDNRVAYGERMLTVGDNDYDDLYRFVKDVDVLVTDYSSIYFDFLLCRKPIVLFPFDLDDYVAHSRPFYFDYKLMEGKKVYTWHELEMVLRNRDYTVPSDKTVALFNHYRDGQCCRRLFDKMRPWAFPTTSTTH